MTRTLTDREKRIAAIDQELRDVVRHMEMDWPKAHLDDPMLTGDKRILHKARVYDTDCVRQGADIIKAMLVAADGIHALMTLAGRDRKAFDAIVILAQIELDRQPEAVAA